MDTLPSSTTEDVDFFDRMSERVSSFAGQKYFFFACLIVILIWLPSFQLFKNLETWQLPINTLTTIITFLMVAIIQNTQNRSDKAIHKKLNAIAQALGDLMDHMDDEDLDEDIEELKRAVGLEYKESS